jgi:archaemetzincin
MEKSAKFKTLLVCGILSSLLYIFTDIAASVIWSDYEYASQTVSELFAVAAPTRSFVVICFILYALLIYVFGLGIWLSANGVRSLKIAAALIVGKEILGLMGTLFFPIHLRDVDGNYSDIMHGIVTAAGVFLFMFPAMIAGAVRFKGTFRYYSITTMILFIVFGVMAGLMQPELAADLPTPMMGIWERINIYGYMIWIIVFAIKLLKATAGSPGIESKIKNQKMNGSMRITLNLIMATLVLTRCSPDNTTKVGLQPFDNVDPSISDSVSAAIKKNYGFSTYILKIRRLPPETFVNIKSPRYRADRLIQILKQEKPDSLDYIIGLTEKDISFTKTDLNGNIKKPPGKYSDWGIFGLGYRPGPSCIISTYRLKTQDKTIFMDRLKKISIHELGHNLGLKHCDSALCVMQDAAETVNTIDKVKARLCDNCKNKLTAGI